jgi:hypothetical protein
MLNEMKLAMMPVWRKRRMDAFLRIMRPKRGARILDVGGIPRMSPTVPGMWQLVNSDFKVTLLNLPGSFSHHQPQDLQPYSLIEADACEFPSLSFCFDIVFSNSVIEHVGGIERQQNFASFVMTAGSQYWVQTPSPAFPLEAHCNLPFWWFYPEPLQSYFFRRWKANGVTSQMATTRAISSRALKRLFPDCSIYTERLLGFPKSIIAFGGSKNNLR